MTTSDTGGESDAVTVAMARIHEHWQHAIADAVRQRSWIPPRHEASGGPVPWEEVASLAVECILADVDEIIRPWPGCPQQVSTTRTDGPRARR